MGRCSRLVFDKDTGKPKGFGFCEYGDSATAESARRNLNGREVLTRFSAGSFFRLAMKLNSILIFFNLMLLYFQFNGRTLRVDVADDKGDSKPSGSQMEQVSQVGASAGVTQVPSNPQTAMQSDINKLIDAMSPAQLYEVMVQLKVLGSTLFSDFSGAVCFVRLVDLFVIS